MYVYTTDVIKANEAQVTTSNQVFFIMHRANTELKKQIRIQMIKNTDTHMFYYSVNSAETKRTVFLCRRGS